MLTLPKTQSASASFWSSHVEPSIALEMKRLKALETMRVTSALTKETLRLGSRHSLT